MTLLLWVATYLVHSTCCLLPLLLVRRHLQDERLLEGLWRAAMLGPVVSASVVWAGAPAWWQIELPMWPGLTVVPEAPARLDRAWSLLTIAPLLAGGALVAGTIALARDLLQRAAFIRGLAREPADDALERELRDLQTLMRIRHRVALTRSPRLDCPVAIGSREICLPERALRELSRRERRACLAHELAHIARRDALWTYFMTAVHRLLWIQPLNREARRELLAIAETACDRRAAESLHDPHAVAECLLTIAAWPRGSANAAVQSARGTGGLACRIQKLLATAPPPQDAGAHRRAAVAAGWLLLAAMPAIALPPPPSVDYWIGYEIGRRQRANDPDAARRAPGGGNDLDWRRDLERRLRAERMRTSGSWRAAGPPEP